MEQSGLEAAKRGTEQGAWEKEVRIGPSFPLDFEWLEMSWMCSMLSLDWLLSVLHFLDRASSGKALFWLSSNLPFSFLL